MKKILIVLLALISFISLTAQENSKLHLINKIQVYEFSDSLDDYVMIQDWMPYQAKALFVNAMFFLGGEDDHVNTLDTWACYMQDIAPIREVMDDHVVYTSTWLYQGTQNESMVRVITYMDNRTIIEHFLGRYIFKYKVII